MEMAKFYDEFRMLRDRLRAVPVSPDGPTIDLIMAAVEPLLRRILELERRVEEMQHTRRRPG